MMEDLEFDDFDFNFPDIPPEEETSIIGGRSSTQVSSAQAPAPNFSITNSFLDFESSEDGESVEFLAQINLEESITSSNLNPKIISTPSPRNTAANLKEEVNSNNSESPNSESSVFKTSFFTTINKSGQKRSFPGPAGILPNISDDEIQSLSQKSLFKPSSTSESSKNYRDEIESAEESLLRSNLDPNHLNVSMELLLSELNLQNESFYDEYLGQVNIGWIKKRGVKLPLCRQVPFLVGVLQENSGGGKVEKFGKEALRPYLTLVDATGVIDAGIDISLLTEFSNELRSGSAVALKNVGAYRYSKRGIILTISKQNIVCIVSKCLEEDEKKSIKSKSETKTNLKIQRKEVNYQGTLFNVHHFSNLNSAKIVDDYRRLVSGVDAINEKEEEKEDEENEIPPVEKIPKVQLFSKSFHDQKSHNFSSLSNQNTQSQNTQKSHGFSFKRKESVDINEEISKITHGINFDDDDDF